MFGLVADDGASRYTNVTSGDTQVQAASAKTGFSASLPIPAAMGLVAVGLTTIGFSLF